MLLPGFTDYHRRLQYQTFDVTGQIRPGENVVLAVRGDGWYRGNLGAFNKKYCYGEKTAFACRLEIVYEDGSAHLTSSKGLAGSTLNINKGLRILIEEALVPIDTAINSCTKNSRPRKITRTAVSLFMLIGLLRSGIFY